MSSHFTSFTPDAMRTFGQALSAGAAERHELIVNLLATANRDRHQTESRRRKTAAEAADSRRLFVSELQSGVHALRTRFALDRRDMVADFQQMASELNAARQAFHDRAGFQQRAARPAGARPRQAAPTHSPATHSATTHSATTHSPTTHSPTTHSPTTHSPTTHSEPTHSEGSKPPQGEKSEPFKKRHG